MISYEIGTIDIHTQVKGKSYIEFKDYIQINNLFDHWVLENKDYIKTNQFRRKLVIMGAFIGLKIGGKIEWILQRY